MDSTDAGILLLLLLLFVAGAFFTMMETALTEGRRAPLERLAENGDADAKAALALLERQEQPLALAQLGITLTSILIGILAGAFCAPALSGALAFLPQASLLAFLLCAVLVTAAALLACESLPKEIARQNPERCLLKYHAQMRLVTRLASPLLSLLTGGANLLLLLLGINPKMQDVVTEDEVKELIEQGTEDGTFEKAEQAMVDRIFRMSDQTAYALMTPRTQMRWLDLADSVQENLAIIRKNPQEVFPVGRESLDDFCGVLYSKDLLLAALEKTSGEIDLAACLKKPLFVPRSMESFRVLEKFRDSGLREAIVLDEYGGVIGFLTMEGLMREILGSSESRATAEQDAYQFTPAGKGSWYVDGLCSIDDFKARFSIDELPDEAHDHYQTMGGFLMSYFGYIPKKGETCEWNGFTFEVARMDRARIDRILVTQSNATPAPVPSAT